MKIINLTKNLGRPLLFLSLFLLGIQQSYGQERTSKINTIIDSLHVVEGQKLYFNARISHLQYNVEREDGFYATIDYDPNRKLNVTLEKNPAISKTDILEAKKDINDNSIDIVFTKNGARKFHLLTKNNIGKPIPIVIDKHIVSMPIVNMEILGGKAAITGNFTEKEVEDMIRHLKGTY